MRPLVMILLDSIHPLTKRGEFTKALVVFLLVLSIPSVVFGSDADLWKEVPDRLKYESGIERKGEYLFSTAMITVLSTVRPDKAHESARKKSLLRALQLVHMASACPHLIEGFGPEEQEPFKAILLPLLPSVHIKGTTVIRQWEKGQHHFTALAVPLNEIQDLPCPFKDISSLISDYVKSDTVTSKGLAFCLRHAPRYSALLSMVKERADKLFVNEGQDPIALCFRPDKTGGDQNRAVERFILQNRLDHAAHNTVEARALAEKGQWKEAILLVKEALDAAPTYGQAYLVLADYFLLEEKNAALAICAVEKAFRDGTCLEPALTRMVSCLRQLRSPEAQVYNFLLSGFQGDSKDSVSGTFQASWKETLGALAGAPVPYLVMLSLGQVISGPAMKPDQLYVKAAEGFSNAKTDEDMALVVQTLIQACEKQPASPETYNLIGACFRNAGRISQALPFLWQAMKLRPDYDYALANLGLCCQELGLMKSARFYFEQEAVKNSSSSWVKECYVRFQETDK